MKIKMKKFLAAAISIALVIYYFSGIESGVSVEEYDVISGFGGDIKTDNTGAIEYSVPYGTYVFPQESTSTTIIRTGKASTIAQTRESRQLYNSRAFLLGGQKIQIVSQRYAEKSMTNDVSILFGNPKINDRAIICVSKNKSEDVLKYKVEGYPSSADYIEDMIRNSIHYNFFTKDYTLLNMYIRLGTEGRSLVMPYIELTAKGIELTGMAVFKGDKMISKLNMQDTRIMNMLRENNVRGMLTIDESSKRYINYYAKTNKKLTMRKIGDKQQFIINLKLKGDIVSNTLYNKMDENFKKDFEKKISKKVEEECNSFIDKMKNEYKTDFLQLGEYATTRYGKNTGTDWDEVVSNSDILIKVEAKVDKIGRGEY